MLSNFADNFESLDSLTDEHLVSLSKCKNENALEILLNRYRGLVHSKVNTYYLVGAEKDDIIQEGMIGLYKAVMDYDEKGSAAFKTFAGICITRQIITAIKTANRKKHIPLNNYISFDKKVYGVKDERTLIEVFPEEHHISDPEQIVIDRENYDGFEYRLNRTLSKLELKVLAFYLEGMTYQEISELINKDIKSVDNALQRIKKKVEALLKEDDCI